MTSAEFYELTPGEIVGLSDRFREAEQRHDRRFAALMTLYANSHRDPAKRFEPFTIEDFTGQSRVSHNGHVDPQQAIRETKRQLAGAGVGGRELAVDDPKAKVDADEIAKFLETLNG